MGVAGPSLGRRALRTRPQLSIAKVATPWSDHGSGSTRATGTALYAESNLPPWPRERCPSSPSAFAPRRGATRTPRTGLRPSMRPRCRVSAALGFSSSSHGGKTRRPTGRERSCRAHRGSTPRRFSVDSRCTTAHLRRDSHRASDGRFNAQVVPFTEGAS